MKIERSFDVARINEIANDPSIYPWVHGPVVGPLDLEPLVKMPENIFIVGEHGLEVFICHQTGIYEAHTMVLPSGRGKWAVEFAEAALHFLFTATMAVEVWTRIPEGNRRALALVKAIGGIFESRVERGYTMDHKVIPADIYALRIQDWMRSAKRVQERGHWFHDRLKREFSLLESPMDAHADDPTHDRYVGIAVDMILAGQFDKAAIFYNRYAVMANYQPLKFLTLHPPTIDIGKAVLVISGESFWVMDTNRPAPTHEGRAT